MLAHALNICNYTCLYMSCGAAADAVGVDGQSQLPLEAMPSAACLLLLRVLLELLMHEIKAETKKHLMMQLQMAAAAAAGSAGVSNPDASIARPLKQVKQMIKAVHRMQLMVDFQKQLLAAADLSDLWVGASCGSSLAALAVATQQAAPSDDCSTGTWQTPRGGSKQQLQLQQQQQPASEGHKAVNPDVSPPSPKGLHPWSLYNLLFEENSESSLNEAVRNSLGALSQSKSVRIHEAADSTGPGLASAASHDGPVSNISIPGPPLHLSSFPAALMSACMQQLERVPAELPLLALQVLWDARRLLSSCGLLNQGLVLLQQQEKVCMACYMQLVVPMAYEHFKVSTHWSAGQVPKADCCSTCPCSIKNSPTCLPGLGPAAQAALHPLTRSLIQECAAAPCCVHAEAGRPSGHHDRAAEQLHSKTTAASEVTVPGQPAAGAVSVGHASRLCRDSS